MSECEQQLKSLVLELEQLRGLCAAAYQVVGVCGGPADMLDNLWAAANGSPLPHDTTAGLPFHPKAT